MNLFEVLFAVALTIAGSFWGFYLNRFLERKSLPKITLARRKAISGKWIGKYAQDDNINRERKDLSIELELNAGSREIKGKMIVEEERLKFEFSILGSFHHNKYLSLNYTASEETAGAIDFGSIFLSLGDFPDKMTGKVAGYGSISEALISGDIHVEKAKA